MPARTPSPHVSRATNAGNRMHTPVQPDRVWPHAVPLFPQLTEETCACLAHLPEALHAVRPLNATHRRCLPEDVATLSRLLTTERAGLCKPYWGKPAAVSAYLYYFLPWNLIRLARLLAALPLPDPRAVRDGEALLLDMGSGPLTLPLALWLARPEWRGAPVHVLALDASPQPLHLGNALMTTLGSITGLPPWKVSTVRAPLEQATHHALHLLAKGHMRPWLVSAVNVLNEVREGRRQRGTTLTTLEDDDAYTMTGERDIQAMTDTRLEDLLASLAPLWTAAADKSEKSWPALLFVEPGTRLGGSTIMRLRRLALDGGLKALAPCTHQETCPLERSRTWCHFTFDSIGTPSWLAELSNQAGLGKSGLSLAPLLLTATPEPEFEDGRLQARIVSSPFVVPDLRGRARYACSRQGLLLLEQAEGLRSGDLVSVDSPLSKERDRKSGARIVRQRNRIKHAPRPVHSTLKQRSGSTLHYAKGRSQ